jgi:hypothetical protein
MKNEMPTEDQGLGKSTQGDHSKDHVFIRAINIGRESGTSTRSFVEIISNIKHKITKA